MLHKLNPHERDGLIKFEEDQHRYSKDLIDFTSATTIISKFFPKFDPDKVIADMKKSPYWKNNKYYGMKDEDIKRLWQATGNNASNMGTKLHEDIEKYYNGIKVSNTSPEWEYFLNFANDYKRFTPYRTEWVIFDEVNKIAGTIDMLFKFEDEFIMVDWKRSAKLEVKGKIYDYCSYPLEHLPSSNFYKYSLQQNLYKYILEKYYGIKIKNMFLLQLHPLKNQYELIECEHLQSEIKNMLDNI